MKLNKSEIQSRINGLNEYMLSDSTKKLVLLKISNDYTYNKAVALIDKSFKRTDWYSIDDKRCFKTWNEIEAYLDGICKAKNTNFYEEHER
jgi:hypothetical protein